MDIQNVVCSFFMHSSSIALHVRAHGRENTYINIMWKIGRSLPFAFIPQEMQKFSLEGNSMHEKSVRESIGPHSLGHMWELMLKT